MFKRMFVAPQTKGQVWTYYALRGVIAYLLYRFVLDMMGGGLTVFNGSEYEDLAKGVPLAAIIAFLAIPFAFYSIMRAFALSDRFGYEMTEAQDGEDATQKTVRLTDALGNTPHLVTFFTALVLYLMLPLSFGYHYQQSALGFAKILGAESEKALFGGVLMIVYLLVIALAQRSARREWQRTRAMTHDARVLARPDGVEGFLRRQIGRRYLIAQLVIIVVLYTFGVYAAALLMFIAWPFLRAIVAHPLSIVLFLLGVLALILLVCLPSVLRAVRKRRRLIRSIRRVCAERGYELSPIRRPLRGMFSTKKGSDFTVKVGEQTYECKLLASVMPMAEMLFRHDGLAEISHGVRVYLMARALYAEISHSPRIHLYTTMVDYDFDSEHKKILIVCPTAAQTYVVWGGDKKPIDTGAIIGDYFLYNTTGFIGALERDCLWK